MVEKKDKKTEKVSIYKPKTTNAQKTTTVKKADKKLLARDIAKNFRI